MITGIVNAEFEPIIPLSVCDSDGKIYTQDAIVDTGFNGWLYLERPIYSLSLTPITGVLLRHQDRIYLYNDGCVPTESTEHMKNYLERLKILAKLKVD